MMVAGLGSDADMPDRDEQSSVGLFVELRIELATQKEKLDHINAMLSEMRTEFRELKSTFVQKSELSSIEKRIVDLEDWQKWTLRGIVALIFGVIGSAIYLKGGVPH
ncbi:MAG: hypothetical protein WAP03_19290 [Methylorubrum rhodinum]|uniref:hypothetical protein n=1 Tax=Methylorubrum rhodinum TaxID=29428 RepID=UPI003BAFA7D7